MTSGIICVIRVLWVPKQCRFRRFENSILCLNLRFVDENKMILNRENKIKRQKNNNSIIAKRVVAYKPISYIY